MRLMMQGLTDAAFEQRFGAEDACLAALAGTKEGMDTRELARAVIRAKNIDENDPVLRKAIGFRVVQVMLRQKTLGLIAAVGSRRGVRIWSLC